jgi:MYXO-CTERM domain-containing protein
MSSASRSLLVLVGALCLAAVASQPARADGDPASDYLLAQRVFVPFDGKIPSAEAGRLAQLLHDGAARGYEVRVALITTQYDLGSVTSLWRQPQRYALFLGQELYFVYRGRLLVVMPNGYGVSRGGKPEPAMSKALDGLAPPRGGGAGFVTAAERAVRRLAGSSGVKLSGSAQEGGGHGATRDRILIGAVALAALALLGAATLRRRRRAA